MVGPTQAPTVERQLRRVFREYTRGRTPLFAVLFLDLDRFKLSNDSLGHEAGDLLLTSLSARLIPCVQAIDTIARVGGDEFSLLLERLTSEDDAHRVAEQIQRALEQPFVVEGHEVVMSCSIGIAFASRRHPAMRISSSSGGFTPETLSTWARPGMSAHLEIITGGTDAPALAVPRAAVQRDGTRLLLFRRDPRAPDEVIRIDADLGTDDGRWVVIESGLRDGDEVVLDGAYQLMLASSDTAQKGGHFHADGTFHEEGH